MEGGRERGREREREGGEMGRKEAMRVRGECTQGTRV